MTLIDRDALLLGIENEKKDSYCAAELRHLTR